MRQIAAAWVAGALFGTGLVVSSMSRPDVVLDFLDVAGRFDASLLWVMGSAVATAGIGYHLVFRTSRPTFASRFHVPSGQRIDARLLLGAALFGVGWGATGYCPGPALVNLASGNPDSVVFVGALLSTGILYRLWIRRRSTTAMKDGVRG